MKNFSEVVYSEGESFCTDTGRVAPDRRRKSMICQGMFAIVKVREMQNTTSGSCYVNLMLGTPLCLKVELGGRKAKLTLVKDAECSP